MLRKTTVKAAYYHTYLQLLLGGSLEWPQGLLWKEGIQGCGSLHEKEVQLDSWDKQTL